MAKKVIPIFGFILAIISLILLVAFIKHETVVFFAVVAVFCTLISCIYQDLSVKKITGEGIRGISWVIQIAFNGAFAVLSWIYFNNPWVYAVMLLLLAILSSFNTEGVHRQYAWGFLIILYSLMIVFSVSHYADVHGGVYKGYYFWWWITPIAVASIANFGVSNFCSWLRAKKKNTLATAKVVSKKVITKLDNIAENSAAKS